MPYSKSTDTIFTMMYTFASPKTIHKIWIWSPGAAELITRPLPTTSKACSFLLVFYLIASRAGDI